MNIGDFISIPLDDEKLGQFMNYLTENYIDSMSVYSVPSSNVGRYEQN